MGKFGKKRKIKRAVKAEEADVDGVAEGVVRLTKPTERYRMSIIEKVEVIRPPLPIDSPALIRVYLNTVQRVPLTYKSLSSYAAFILTCDTDRKVVLWFGAEVEEVGVANKACLYMCILSASSICST
jgi:hypothetical protein